MTLRPPARGSFETLVTFVDVDISRLRRMSRFPATEPYWARRKAYRFDDPHHDETKRFGVLYVATDADVAFTESVLHENSTFTGGAFVLSAADLLAREVVTFKHPTRTTLRVADLTGPALKRLGLNNDVSASASYGSTQKWARAIHTALPHLDGIRYVSRQFNTQFCFAVFDRAGLLRDGQSALTKAQLGQLCAKFNIRAV